MGVEQEAQGECAGPVDVSADDGEDLPAPELCSADIESLPDTELAVWWVALNRRILERDLGHTNIDVLAEGLNVVAVSTTAVVVSSPATPPIVVPSPPTLVIRPNGGGGEYEISIEASGVLVASWSISEMSVGSDLAELAAVLTDHTGPQVFIAASPDVPFSVIVHVMDVAENRIVPKPVLHPV